MFSISQPVETVALNFDKRAYYTMIFFFFYSKFHKSGLSELRQLFLVHDIYCGRKKMRFKDQTPFNQNKTTEHSK